MNKSKGRKNRRRGNGWSRTDGDKVGEGVEVMAEAQGQAVVKTEAQGQVVVEEDEKMSEG
jgi:hypothetical protein